ncbi:MAG: single-stranded-DNA-specific exonuclease RecJ, partial [Desulfobulbaceae bacterium]|nr:single-stranded-DNA-specific exonuclease RecJ [Desulfobulbaceae bacterium]
IIFGDYDVDGVTGVAVLALFLKELGVAYICRQPKRLEHGYGFSTELVEDANKNTVVVTVDCGISDVSEVARAKELDLTVIVTDHHQPPPVLPAADAILNPLQPGCAFPFKHLAGVGVAFYLAMGLRGHLLESGYFSDRTQAPNLKAYLDLVAIGTICDMTPLVDANRIMTIAGLDVLARTNRPGLRHLLAVANIDVQRVNADDIGYRIGPRLNAPGRLGDAEPALRLLLSEDQAEAKALAKQIDATNQERQEIVRQVSEEALARAARLVAEGARVLVLHDKEWHGGILGIAASRLAEDFNRPTLLLTTAGNGLLKGSGRSVAGMDIHDVLTGCADLLASYGGHSCAVGVSLVPENLAAFVERLEVIIAQRLDLQALEPLLWIDHVLSAEELGENGFMEGYQRLAPFGIGNPEPVFATASEISFENARVVGLDHLKFTSRINGVSFSGIGFGLGGCLEQVEGRSALPAFTIQKNFFRGREEWQLNIVDISAPTTT